MRLGFPIQTQVFFYHKKVIKLQSLKKKQYEYFFRYYASFFYKVTANLPTIDIK